MFTRVVGSSLAVLALGGGLLAQPQGPPKPGPEHKPLQYFVGKWKTDAELKPGPLGPGGKMTSVDTCEWFAGGFHVVCRGDGSGALGKMSSLGIMAYSAQEKNYTFYGIDSMGNADLSKGSKNGNTWTFTATSTFGGQTFQSRFTIVETSPKEYTFRWEQSADGKKWAVLMEGKSTKV
ncbi:MAG TPA: DUF1579 family protein [Vicinamibacterales bacterium]|jgi:hypothetical protein